MTLSATRVNLCPVCAREHILEVLYIIKVPIQCNVLWENRQDALNAARADIHLVFCQDCGHVFNQAFQPEKMGYADGYENSLHFSPSFQEYASALAADLVVRYDLNGKDILEIGSGRGDFLKMLVELGQNRGVGFDPSYPGLPDKERVKGLDFVQDYYSERYSNYPADFVVSRHVLEHLPQPRQFLEMLHRTVGNREHIILFFEVPNVLYTLHELGIWDLIYEHYSYFSPPSLRKIFERTGFDVVRVLETFNAQFLTIEARPSQAKHGDKPSDLSHLELISQDVACFAESYRRKLKKWKIILTRFQQAHQRVVVWGCGSKGISFLNTFAIGGIIQYAVDINPRKQGMFITGAGQEIVAPSFLKTYQPDVIILMNPNYQAEVQEQLRDLGLNPEILLA